MSGEDAPRPYLENLIVLEIKTNKQTVKTNKQTVPAVGGDQDAIMFTRISCTIINLL